MRRTVLILASAALILLLAGGVALAVTKHCRSWCSGTRGGDTLLGDDRGNGMEGACGETTP
jgi:hypothetical protein